LGLLGGYVKSKGMVTGPFNYDEENSYLKVLIRRIWEKRGGGGGQVALYSSWLVK